MALLCVNSLIYLQCFPCHVDVVAALSPFLPVCVFNLGKLWQSQITSEFLAPCSSPGWPLLPGSPFPVLALHVVFVVFLCGGEELNPELI